MGGDREADVTARSTHRPHAALLLGVAAFLIVSALLVLHLAAAGNGPAWRRDGLPGATVHSLSIDPRRSGMVFAAAETGVYRRDPSGPWRRVLRAYTVWGVQVLSDGRTVIAGDQAGTVYISHDLGHHWIGSPVTAMGVYAVSGQPGHPDRLLAGAGGGVYLSLDGGVHWQRRLALPNAAGAAFAWRPGTVSTVFAGSVAGAAGGSTRVFVSRDGGMHWATFGRALGSRGGIMSLAAPRAHLDAGTMGNRLWTIPLTGGTWQQHAAGVPANQHVSGIADVPGPPETTFIATLGAGVFRSDNGGRRWAAASDGLPSVDQNQIILSLAYAPREHSLYAGTTDGVFRMHTGAPTP